MKLTMGLHKRRDKKAEKTFCRRHRRTLSETLQALTAYLRLGVQLGEEGAETEPGGGGDALHVAAAAAVEQHHLHTRLHHTADEKQHHLHSDVYCTGSIENLHLYTPPLYYTAAGEGPASPGRLFTL
jgi:hypothetical protein